MRRQAATPASAEAARLIAPLTHRPEITPRCPLAAFLGHGSGRTELALEAYQRAQDGLVAARNRLARAIAGAAMPGLTQDEIVEVTGYTADRVLRICTDAGVGGTDG
ncbi:MAG TPA: hypothetical protein VGS60_05590 [Actinomycetes bacterium]|nr:hypothetical protein [Actinomycetes bacterium]